MRILYLVTKAERGGAQSHLWTLMRAQTFGDPILAVGEDGFLADQARAAGIPVYVMRSLVHPISPWRDLQAMIDLARLIRSERPAIVHAHTAKAGMIARIAGALTGTPVIYTVHAWSFVSAESCRGRAAARGIERALGRFTDGLIDVSQSNFEMARRVGVAPMNNHFLIPNGVPDDHRRAAGLLNGDVEVIMVARFAPPKHHALLLEALAPLPGNWHCTFVGAGPDQPRAEAMSRRLRIAERVRFLGDRDDIPELLAQAQIFVLASDSESLPISILEAMRAGLPVIASDVGGCGELVTHDVTGFLVAPGDAARLRESLAPLLISGELRERFGRAGRARFESHFGVEKMVAKTMACYRRVCVGRSFTFPEATKATRAI